MVVAIRERTHFSADVLHGLNRLKLLVTTGMANAAIDIPAANAQGIVVCGTGYPEVGSTSELTWALILAAVRNLLPPKRSTYARAGGK